MAPELIAAVREPPNTQAGGLDQTWAAAEPRIVGYLRAAGFDDATRLPRILTAINERLQAFLPLHPGEEATAVAMRETAHWVANQRWQTSAVDGAESRPQPAGLEMPEQTIELFRAGRRAAELAMEDTPLPAGPDADAERRGPAGGVRARRILFALLVVSTTAVAVALLGPSIQQGGTSPLEFLLLVLYALLFAWICTAFWTATMGFLLRFLRVDRWDVDLPARTRRAKSGEAPRVALVMPVYNESPEHVFARLQAIWESTMATRAAADVDLFVLSDTRDPDLQVEEELRWAALVSKTGGRGRIFYRHRRDNTHRKAGNIADFVRNWGRRYRYMAVLDADSLMSGRTLLRMRDVMETRREIAILQAPPVPVNNGSLFARVLQFATALYGPLYTAGMNFWQASDGSYFGHNAMIRTEAFARHCGLPSLPGQEPLGGSILSHDFVEAAMLRRNGWEIWVAPNLGGSFEELPPTLIDYAKRDRRWCQGNLQHGRLISARGWRGLTRLHFTMALMSYLASPLWFLFLFATGAEAWLQSREQPVYFFGHSLFPVWPTSYATELMTVLLVTLTILFLPKVLALVLLMRERRSWHLFGGRLRAATSVLLESLVSAIMAPILMLFQTKFVAAILLRRNVGWPPQRRADHGTTFREALGAHGWQTLTGIGAGLVCWLYVPAFFWWFTPVLAGLLLAVPFSMVTSRVRAGKLARRAGLFVSPQEVAPAPVVRRYREIIATETSLQPQDRTQSMWMAPLLHPPTFALHRRMLPGDEPSRREQHYVDGLMYALIDQPGIELDAGEKRAMLANPHCLDRVHTRLWTELPVPRLHWVVPPLPAPEPLAISDRRRQAAVTSQAPSAG
jgi:membrane glycosyltransferase